MDTIERITFDAQLRHNATHNDETAWDRLPSSDRRILVLEQAGDQVATLATQIETIRVRIRNRSIAARRLDLMARDEDDVYVKEALVVGAGNLRAAAHADTRWLADLEPRLLVLTAARDELAQ